MYIRNVLIENYRAFKKFEITLSRLSLIIGENEAGKTNLFDALSLPLNSSDISFNKKRLSVSDINRETITEFYQAILDKKPDVDIKRLIPKVCVEIEFTDPNNSFEEHVLANWITGEESDDSYKIKYDFRPKNEDDFVESVNEILKGVTKVDEVHWFNLPIEYYDYDVTQSNNGKKLGFSDLKYISFNSINAERDDFSESNTQKSNSILTKMLFNSLNATDKAKINSSYTSFFDAIESAETFGKIVQPEPEFKNFFNRMDKLECIPNLPNLKSILSNITLKSGESYLYQRGLGYRNLVFIFLLFEFFKMDKKVFNLCCIEEPEAHLSVNNLRFATDFIYKSTESEDSGLQTLVSSHNPQVINKLQLSNVIVLSGDKATHLNDTKSKLTNYLRKRPNFDFLKLLFSGRTILVEGTTEEMLINSILNNDDKNVHPVEVISIGQKGFKTFMDIWLQVNKGNEDKKLGVIRDRDDHIKDAKAKIDHEKYDTDNANIIVRTTEEYTLENDLVGAGDNLKSLRSIFGREGDDVGQMAKYLISNKAESMLKICDAIFEKDKEKNIVLPAHIQEVVDFITHD
jgi:predicted ATP-dependent endonuclease of OLD family